MLRVARNMSEEKRYFTHHSPCILRKLAPPSSASTIPPINHNTKLSTRYLHSSLAPSTIFDHIYALPPLYLSHVTLGRRSIYSPTCKNLKEMFPAFEIQEPLFLSKCLLY